MSVSEIESKNLHWSPWRRKLYKIIFEHDTPAGKAFDVVLLWVILLSVLIVMLESVSFIKDRYGNVLRIMEWCFTILFTIEYILRIVVIDRTVRYIFSFYGIIDFLSVIPTYLSIVFVGGQYLLVIRTIRLLRVFRILKLVRYTGEGRLLMNALFASRYKIIVFFGAVMITVIICGTVMYLIEGEENGFSSIPRSVYWAIVTLTTVGYGDIAPQTVIGQALASFIMLMGYAIIAVPTGIVTAEISQANRKRPTPKKCPKCQLDLHDIDAQYCKRCGTML
ncbi:ion transporter [Fulvivirgaceae bacterium BMA10]|uniref:Ion transporter n=1 Tax=Splendidivirga corallicola TaxID=3051826 RepID=A0ABT8KUC1_9BACT|nr:ion transporter [Fulvivirgaceae bacterium BMA10]